MFKVCGGDIKMEKITDVTQRIYTYQLVLEASRRTRDSFVDTFIPTRAPASELLNILRNIASHITRRITKFLIRARDRKRLQIAQTRRVIAEGNRALHQFLRTWFLSCHATYLSSRL